MADPVISEIKYLGSGTLDMVEIRIPDDYPDPENLVMVIYDRTHNGSTTASPAASDIYAVTNDGLLYTEDTDNDGNDDDGVLHYTFGTSENGDTIRLHAQDAVGLYNSVTGETYGLYSFGNDYTVSTNSGDPFAGVASENLDTTGQQNGVTSLERQPGGTYTTNTSPDPGSSYICFTQGTMILTDRGERSVQSLAIGDRVITKDAGLQTIRWIGQRHFAQMDQTHAHLQPITIKAHAFGHNIPMRDIKLSPNHAILNDSWKNTLYFAQDEVLALAKSFIGSDFVYQSTDRAVTYFHILLDQHALIQSNGMWAESLYLGDESLDMLSAESREEVFEIFPELRSNLGGYGYKARHMLRPKEAALLV
ncbi:Hint domain-containing protein [Amylibacter sp. IMCC11727]|uniref:Hint domain-containing protein n=1 Tax=Amylibacter sp. IMCC11727 TaxID=3039851 RepID=UPI00244DDFCC|nr:Hint domain-containing protein [Amylibacter sp. IMCC11727]WGI20464.1 Hint domain-containing protein [Amylibacter sp. IMCC11727]